MQPISLRILLGFVFLLLANAESFGQTATLSSPTRSGDQFQFNLEGDPYRRYVVQGSSNLQDWVLLTISVSTGPTHPLSFAATNDFRFFRTMLYTRANSLFKAIQLKGSFELMGNNIFIDSFNSGDPAWSTAGQYDPAKSKDTAEISLDQGMTNSLGVGNVRIDGSVAVGPDAPVMIGSNGSVGDFAWHNTAQVGIQPGKLLTDLNPHFLEVKEPFTGGYSTTAPGAIVTNVVITTTPEGIVTNYIVENHDYIFDEGNYKMTELSGKVLVRGIARVFITDLLEFTGQDKITIETNASLELYVGATNAMIGGNGIINKVSNATNFIYYGLPGNTSVAFAGNSSFTGIIYAPQARVIIGGGSADTYDFIGAIVAGSVLMNGHYSFHYDEALRWLPFPQQDPITSP
jgi:hypothetical protein